MVRDSKKERGASLTTTEIKSIPERFRSLSTKWFYDKNQSNVLMAFIRDEDSYLKVAINLDEKIGKGIANEIISAGRVDNANLREKHNEEIKGKS